MSQPDSKSVSSGRNIYGEKPRANMYTALLIVALLALLFGCLFLILEINFQKKSGEGFFAPVRPAMMMHFAARSQCVAPSSERNDSLFPLVGTPRCDLA